MEKAPVEAIPGVPFKLSWGALFGGIFVALGVWILLYALGLSSRRSRAGTRRTSPAASRREESAG